MHLQPDGVGQVRSTQIAIALGIFAVAGRAVIHEDLLSGFDHRRIARLTGEADNIGRCLTYFVRLKHICKSGHLADTSIGIDSIANSMRNSLVDGIYAATPKPVIVVKVGITFTTGCTGSVTGRAVDAESRRAAGHGKLVEFRVGDDFFWCRSRDPFKDCALGCFCCRHFVQQRTTAGIAENTAGRIVYQRPCRIKDGVSESPDDRGVKRPHPPAGHGIVQFADAVPLVAGGFDAADLIDMFVRHFSPPSEGSGRHRLHETSSPGAK
ncbi:hypothetical protein D3C73_441640 [compost metagenome]